jgi:hypothetical protein
VLEEELDIGIVSRRNRKRLNAGAGPRSAPLTPRMLPTTWQEPQHAGHAMPGVSLEAISSLEKLLLWAASGGQQQLPLP